MTNGAVTEKKIQEDGQVQPSSYNGTVFIIYYFGSDAFDCISVIDTGVSNTLICCKSTLFLFLYMDLP